MNDWAQQAILAARLLRHHVVPNPWRAGAQYRSTVLTAFQNAADAIRALQSDANSLRAAAHSLGITHKQLQLERVAHVLLLNAEAQARLAMVRVQAFRLADTAALFQARGGGWWNRTDLQAAGDPVVTVGK